MAKFELLFHCGDCGKGKEDLLIDLNNDKDNDKLWDWLMVHNADGGSYETLGFQKCSLCSIKHNNLVINHTGKGICVSCAKTIIKEFVEKNL